MASPVETLIVGPYAVLGGEAMALHAVEDAFAARYAAAEYTLEASASYQRDGWLGIGRVSRVAQAPDEEAPPC